jgi:hypothetical protein
MFTARLPNNGRPYIARLRFARMYLLSRCLAMSINITVLLYIG